jgi:hypothetical protein
MKLNFKNTVSLSLICFFLFTMILVNTGCEGTESRKAIDDTVKTAVGMDYVKKKDKIKKQLDQFSKNEAEKMRKGLDEDGTGVSGNGPDKGSQ